MHRFLERSSAADHLSETVADGDGFDAAASSNDRSSGRLLDRKDPTIMYDVHRENPRM